MSDVYKPAFTDRLRTRVRAVAGVCPTCGQTTQKSVRDLAAEMGLAHATLWRFLAGRKPSADVVDRLVDWLDERESA